MKTATLTWNMYDFMRECLDITERLMEDSPLSKRQKERFINNTLQFWERGPGTTLN